MTIESASFISDLNSGLPAHTDPLSEADSHMRLIKAVLKATFPNIKGAVTASDTDLSAVTAALLTLKNLAGGVPTLTGANAFTGSNVFSAPASFTGGLIATSIKKNGAELVPTGVIAMWYGIVANIPAGWTLCDGTNGAPDLRNLYIVGAGGVYSPGAVVGSNLKSVATDNQGLHAHGGVDGLAGGHTHTATSDEQGQHNHTGSDGAVALTVNQIPAHDHGLAGKNVVYDTYPNSNVKKANTGPGAGFSYGGFTSVGGGQSHAHPITNDGLHNHNLTVAGVGNHQHVISDDGAHFHNVVLNVQPASAAICYIMKL